ncbi:MAG: hypothetical protein NTU41_01105 [Chloroflexi bacterium]|nr:hypothetical protein [Chloroflexota bacterium]
MTRVLGWLNATVGVFLLLLIMSGVFSHVLSNISSWNRFDSLGAKVVVSVAGLLAIGSSAYLVLGRGKQGSHRLSD